MGSTRFPGKMLANLGERPVLEWVVRRTLRVDGVQHHVLATSELVQDDPIASLGRSLGIEVFRGPHEDVLQRVLDASAAYDPVAILRICGDNPFVDPGMVSHLVSSYRQFRCDYAFNHRPALGLQVVDGLGGEIFGIDSLRLISTNFSDPRYREHLTLPFWDHPESFSIRAVEVPIELRYPSLRLDVDTPKDLEYLNGLVTSGRLNIDTAAHEIIRCARE